MEKKKCDIVKVGTYNEDANSFSGFEFDCSKNPNPPAGLEIRLDGGDHLLAGYTKQELLDIIKEKQGLNGTNYS